MPVQLYGHTCTTVQCAPLAPGLGLKPDSGAIRESAEVAEVEVDEDGNKDGHDERVDVHVRVVLIDWWMGHSESMSQ
jgi:hypothetical protein